MEPKDFLLDFRSGIPVYEQIVQQVRAFVASGRLKPGDQLPTVRQMASELRVNFNTIARAYRMLDEANLISTQRGRGTYILESSSAERIEGAKFEEVNEQVKRFLAEMDRLGYKRSDVQTSLINSMKTWSENEQAQHENKLRQERKKSNETKTGSNEQ